MTMFTRFLNKIYIGLSSCHQHEDSKTSKTSTASTITPMSNKLLLTDFTGEIMNALISKTRRALTTFLLLSAGIGGIQALHAQSLEYGFIQDPADPQSVTAVFFPDFSRTSYTIPTAVFTFLVPADPLTGAPIATDPAFLDVPASNTIANRNGVWTIAQISPQTFGNFGLDPAVLEGFTVYQASLNPVISNTPDIVAGVPFELFNIRFPDDCPSSMIRMLVNDEPIQQFFINNLFINLNNTMSVAIDGNPTDEFYIGNQPGNDFIDCPILEPVELAAVKSVVDASGNGIAEPGEVLTYTISITNSGQAVADDVSVQDAVADPGITVDGTQVLVIGGASDVLPANPTIADLQAGLTLDIAGGATATVSYSVTVTDPIADGDLSIDNLAVVMDDGADVCASVDSDCDTSTPTAPNISVAKTLTTGGPFAEAGEDLTYTITLTNTGGTAFTFLAGEIEETVPANTTAAGGDSFSCVDGDPAGTTCTNSADAVVPANGSVALTFTVTVDDPIPAGVTSILNSVVVPGECPSVDNDCDEDTPTEPQLVAVKSVAEPGGLLAGIAEAGEVLTYTISISNNGGSVADDVSVQDAVADAGITVDGTQVLVITNASDILPAGPTIADLQAGITLDIAAGATATVSYSVTVTDPIADGDLSIANLAVVTDDGDPVCDNPGSDCDTDTPTEPNISVAKTLTTGGPFAEAGEDLTYTITLTNTGGTAFTFLAGEIEETVPANTTAAGGDSFSCVDGDPAGTTCTNSADAVVPANGSVALTFTVTVDDPIPAGVTSILNSVVVPGECPSVDNDCDEDTPTEPQLVAVKSVAEPGGLLAGIAEAGEVLTYTISISNNGGSVADDVSVQDAVADAGITVDGTQVLVITNASDILPAGPTIADLQAGITLDIAAGATATVSYSVTVTDPIADGDLSIANLAVVTDDGDPVCDNPGSDCDTDTPTEPNISVAKTLTTGGPFAEAGEDLTYTITLTNTGGTAFTFLAGEIEETVPANTTAAGGDSFSCVDGDPAGTTCTNSADAVVPANGSVALTFTVTVDDPIPAGVTSILNSVVVPGECPSVDNDCDEDTPTEPQLVAVKSVAEPGGLLAGIAEAGEVLTYTISISNNGGSVADDVSVQDAVADAGITVDGTQVLVITNASDILPAGPTIADLQAGITLDIAAGATATVSYSVTVTDPIADGDLSIANLAVVTDDGDPVCDNPGSDCDTDTPTEPNISVAKTLTTGGPFAEAGEDLTYTITLTNTGGTAFTFLAGEIEETVPANTTAAGGDSFSCVDGDPAGTTCTNSADAVVPANGSVALTFTVTVDDPIPAGVTSILNSVVVPGECPSVDNDCDEDTPTEPQLVAVKSVAEPGGLLAGIAEAGEVLTYTISISNNGGSVADDVSVQDAVADAGITVDGTQVLVITNASDILPAGPTIADLQAGITLDIAAGATATVSYSVTVTDPIADGDLSIANLAVVTDDGDPVCDNPGSDCDTDTPTEPNISVAKTLTTGGPFAEAGEDLTYTITLTNTGGTAFTFLAGEIEETVPANTTAAGGDSFSCVDGDPAGTTCTNSADAVVPANGSVALTFTVTVDDPLAMGVTNILNSVTVPNECPNAPGQSNDCDEDTPTDPEVAASKSVVDASGDGIAQPGEALTYTISVSNSGGSVANDVSIMDAVNDAGVNVDGTQLLVVVGGSDVQPANPTIADLQAGITVDVAAGATVTVSYTVTVLDPIADNDISIDNIATVMNGGDDACTQTSCMTSTPTDPNISVVKSTDAGGDGIASPGETLSYSITFTNTGGTAFDYLAGEIGEVVPVSTTHVVGDDFSCTPDDNAGSSCSNTAGFTVAASDGTTPGTFTLTFTVIVDDPLAMGVTNILNSVTVPNECPNAPGQSNDCDEDTPTDPEVAASKSVVDASGDGIAQPGEALTYTISVSNSGGSVANDVSIMDAVNDAGVNVDGTQLLVVVGGSDVQPANPTIADLQAGITVDVAAGATVTVSYTVTVLDPIADNDISIDNIATVMNGGDDACTQTSCMTSTPTDPNISVVKSTDAGGDGIASPGETLSYSITFTNTGGTAFDYLAGEIGEVVPVSTTHVVGDDFSCTPDDNAGSSCSNTAGFTVAASDGTTPGTFTLTFTVIVDDPLAMGVTNILNSVTVPNECPNAPGQSNDCDEDTPTDPEVAASKSVVDASGDGIAQPGEALTYTISVSNSGGSVANDVSIMDAVNDAGVNVDGTQLLVVVGGSDVQPANPTIADLQAGITVDVAAGATVTVSYTVTVLDPIADNDISIDNIATVMNGGDDACTQTSCMTSTPTDPNISVVKSTDAGGDGIASPGETLSYSITFTNTGGTAFDYLAGEIGEVVPVSTTHVVGDDFSCTPDDNAGSSCSNTAGFTVAASDGTTPGTFTLTFTVIVDDPLAMGVTNILNSVTVPNECPNAPGQSNDCDEDTPTDPEVAASKSVVDASGDGIAQPGEALTYTISVSNSGGSVANDVSIMDAVNDAGVNVDGTQLLVVVGGSDVQPANPTIADLQAGITVDVAAGATVTVSYTVTVLDPIADNDISIDNIATVMNGGDDACTQTSCMTSTPTDPNISVVKSTDAGGDGIASPGETLSYSITFTNTGGTAFDYLAGEIGEVVPVSTTHVVGDDFSCTPDDNAGSSCSNTAGFTVAASDGTTPGTFTLTFTVIVDDPLAMGVTNILNSVTVPNECPNAPGQSNDCDEDTPTDPEVAASKSVVDASGDGIAQPGEALTYTISVSNSGGSVANDVSIMDAVNDAGVNVDGTQLLVVVGGSDVQPANPTIADLQAGITVDVAAGATVTVSYTVTVLDPIADNDISIDNIATVMNGGDDACTQTSCMTSTPTDPNISVVKSTDAGGDGIASPGETLSYSITFTNTGGTAFDYLAGEIGEVVPVSTTHVVGDDFSCTPDDNAGSSCSNTAGFTVAASDGTTPGTFTLTFTVIVDDPLAMGVTNILNSVTVPNECPNAPGQSNDCDEDTPTDPEVAASKSVVDASGDGIAQPGEALTYTISVSNSGGSVANDVSIMDAVNDAGVNVDGTQLLVVVGGSDVQPANPTIADLQAGITVDVAAGATVTVSYTVTVLDPIADNDISIDNVAIVNDENGAPICTQTSCVTSQPTPGNIIVIKALAAESGVIDNQVEDGETLTYSITLTNVGGQPVSYMAADIIETVPVGTSAVGGDDFDCSAGDPAGSQCFNNNSFTVAASDGTTPGSVTLTFIVVADDPLASNINSIINRVTVPNECNDPSDDDGNVCTVSTPTEPQLITTKAVSDANGDGIADDGEVLTYTISIMNAGTTSADDALVRDPLSDPNLVIDGTQALSIIGGSDVMPANPTINDLRTSGFTIDIASGETIMVIFTVEAADPIPAGVAAILNQATVDNLPSCPDGTPFIDGLPDINGDGVIDLGDDTNGDSVVDQNDCGPTMIPVQNITFTKTITSVNQVSATVFAVNYSMIIDNQGGTDIVYTLDDQLGYPSGPNQINLLSGNASTSDGILEPGLASNGGDFTPSNNKSMQISDVDVPLPGGDSDTYSVSIRVAVNPSQIAGSEVCNGAPGSGFFNEALIVGTVELDDNDCAPIPADRPEIDLNKTNRQLTDNDNDGFGDVGEIIEYTFVIENTGTLDLSNVRLIDRRLQSRDGVFTGCDVPAAIGAGELTLMNPLAPGESATCLGEYTITQDDADNRRVTNTATVLGNATNGQNVTSRASAVFSNFSGGN